MARAPNFSGYGDGSNKDEDMFKNDFENVDFGAGNGYSDRRFANPAMPPATQATQLGNMRGGSETFNSREQNTSGETTDAANILTDLRQAGSAPVAPMGSSVGGQQYDGQHQGGYQYGGQQQGGVQYGMHFHQGGYQYGAQGPVMLGNGTWQQGHTYAQAHPTAAGNHYGLPGMPRSFATTSSTEFSHGLPSGSGNGDQNLPSGYYHTAAPTHQPLIHHTQPVARSFAFGTDTSFGEGGYRGSTAYDEEEKAHNLQSVPLADRLSAQPFGMQPEEQTQQPADTMGMQGSFGQDERPVPGSYQDLRRRSGTENGASGRRKEGTKKSRKTQDAAADGVDFADDVSMDEEAPKSPSPTEDFSHIKHPTLLGLAPTRKKAAPKPKKKKISKAGRGSPRTKLTAEQKRANHTKSEQERRATKDKMLKIMKTQVPVLEGGKSGHSQAEALDDGANYFEATMQTNDRLEQFLNSVAPAPRADASMGQHAVDPALAPSGPPAQGPSAPFGNDDGEADESNDEDDEDVEGGYYGRH
ncbi:hypothetical protein MBLNU230_g8322t1 [Neophaeotheca triangularis]